MIAIINFDDRFNKAEFVVDKVDELLSLPTINKYGKSNLRYIKPVGMGSTVICLEDGKTYMLDGEGHWVIPGEPYVPPAPPAPKMEDIIGTYDDESIIWTISGPGIMNKEVLIKDDEHDSFDIKYCGFQERTLDHIGGHLLSKIEYYWGNGVGMDGRTDFKAFQECPPGLKIGVHRVQLANTDALRLIYYYDPSEYGYPQFSRRWELWMFHNGDTFIHVDTLGELGCSSYVCSSSIELSYGDQSKVTDGTDISFYADSSTYKFAMYDRQ